MIAKARTQSKCSNIIKNLQIVQGVIKIQKYLISDELDKEEQQLLFIVRTRSFNVKSNRKSQFEADMKCRGCVSIDSYEDENHIIQSCSLFNEERGDTKIQFEDAFRTIKYQIKFVKVFKVFARK